VSENAIPDLLNPQNSVKTFYAPGETFQGVFGDLSNAYEECRAEASSLHLCFQDEVLDLYDVPVGERMDFKVVALLSMLHAGVKTLYECENGKWGQAHARARFAIVRALVNWSDGAVSVSKIGEDFKIVFDRAQFGSVAGSVERLVKELNYYKAARLPDQARAFFGELTDVDEFWNEVRIQAIAKKKGLPVTMGATIEIVGGVYTLVKKQLGEKLTALDAAWAMLRSLKLALNGEIK
jgi:dipeptidyl-peptidase-3